MSDIKRFKETTKRPSRLKEPIKKFLQTLIKAELIASQLYRSMAAWCEFVGYDGAATFYYNQYKEEREHMDKVYKYLLDRDCMPITPPCPPSPDNYDSVLDVVQRAYEHEVMVTETYNELAQLCHKEGDFVTLQFANDFLSEQIEEEASQMRFLDRIEAMTNDGAGMILIDHEFKKLAT